MKIFEEMFRTVESMRRNLSVERRQKSDEVRQAVRAHSIRRDTSYCGNNV